MTAAPNFPAYAAEIKQARDTATTVPSFSSRLPGFSIDHAYEIDRQVHALRLAEGARFVGRKIGFSNARMWDKLGLSAPAWARLYEHTVIPLDATRGQVSLSGFLAPRIEPEIVVHFARQPEPAQGVAGVLQAIDWLATGFEVVQSNYQGPAVPADAIANSVYHACLVIGPRIAVADLAGADLPRQLEAFSLTLSRDGETVEQGTGANVLGSPLKSVLALAQVLASQSADPIEAGEIITTGTVTTAYGIQPGQSWSLAVEGIALPRLTVDFTD